MEDKGDHVEVQAGLRSSTLGPELISSMKCLITIRIEVLPNPVFQAQLDSIDEDLARYDTVEKGRGSDSVAQSRGVGSKVVGLAIFLKNLFTQTESCRHLPRNSKPSQVVRNSILGNIELCPAKHMRQESEEEWVVGSNCRKKRVVCFDNPTMEATEQP